MKPHTFIIKNMVCQRCIEAVEEVFRGLDLKIEEIQLGLVKTKVPDNFDEKILLDTLLSRGFDLVKSKEEILVEKTKIAIVKLVHQLEENPLITNSIWLEEELEENYQKVSRTFSSLTNLTIEKYIILHKIERAKELIQYKQLPFESIAYNLGYKNLSHLSNQFKEVENMSLSEFKKKFESNRKGLEEL